MTSKAEQFVILGFTTNTNYANEAYESLAQKCPNGAISPLTTKYYTSLGFLSWTNHIVLEGVCLPSKK